MKGGDWLWLVLVGLLLAAMLATLLFGKGRSRHGYGVPAPSSPGPVIIAGGWGCEKGPRFNP